MKTAARHHLRLINPDVTGTPRHYPGDRIAQAIMAMPAGGEQVEIMIGDRRHSLHHWQIIDMGGDERLSASWCYRDDLPPLQPPLWWRAQRWIRTTLRPWWNP